MTTFNYNYTIPGANNNPSADQPLMLENYQSIHDWAEVDHIGYDVANGGTHKLITFNDVQAPAAPADPVSIEYTANDSGTHPNAYFKNSQATFPMTSIKVFGVFVAPTSTGAVSAGNQFNIASIAYVASGSVGTATITFTGSPLATGTTNANALVIFGELPAGAYTLTASTLVLSGLINTQRYQFQILQA